MTAATERLYEVPVLLLCGQTGVNDYTIVVILRMNMIEYNL